MISCIYEGCNKRFKCNAKFTDHMNVHLKLRPFKCEICESSYPSKKGLDVHKKTHEPPQYSCETCGFKFVHKHALKGHSKICSRKFICDLCNKEYKKRGCYEAHVLKKHPVPRGPRIKCDLCDKTYLDIRSLNAHKKIVHDKKRIHCEFCGKAYSYSIGLKKHLKKCENRSSMPNVSADTNF